MLTLIYFIIITLRNKWYDKHPPNKYSIPVISIGNISTGGTGKTPIVIYICNILKKMGYNPSIVGRGYKRKSKNDIIVSDGKEIFEKADIAGDEMLLIAQKTNATVFATNSKSKFIEKINKLLIDKNNNVSNNIIFNNGISKELPSNFDCIIVDDGFQHRRLYRDLDIVLIDNETLNTGLLPFGKLRETIHSINRADIIILTKGASINAIKQYNKKNIPVLETKQNLLATYILFSNSNNELRISKDENYVALTGIARPKIFLQMLENIDLKIIKHIKYSDHFSYQQKNIIAICKECINNKCKYIVSTEKDAVKLSFFKNIFEKYEISVIIFPLEISIKTDEQLLQKYLEKLFH